jgi:amino acid adenylation domain-containing protein
MTGVMDTYGLSPLQAGILFHSLGGAEPGVDVEQVVAKLGEQVHEQHLLRAWDRLLERHAVLRTRFRWEGVAEPVQEVIDRVQLTVRQFDLRPLDEAERSARLLVLVEEERRRGFDLRQAPLMRLVLVQTAEREHWMLWTVHHILLDGRSRYLLFRELFAFFEAFSRGSDIDLPSPRPFRDYIEWLRTIDQRRAQEYWRELLSGFRSPTPMAVARHRQAEPLAGTAPGVHEVRLSAAITSALQARARAASVTLSTLVHGAWALLLHRYSGEADIVFGVTRNCRRASVPGAVDIWGLIINTLPVRVHVDPGAELVPWLQRLRAQQTEQRDHEHAPLVSVQGWSEVPRGSPLFESLLVFDSQTLDAQLRAAGGTWSQRSFSVLGQTNYPLTVAAYAGEQLLLQIEYSRRLFADDAVARMSAHLQALLEGMAADAGGRLGDLPLLPAAERRQVVESFSGTSSAYPATGCVHEQVEEQARTNPEALAVAGAGQQLTYRELDERAAGLAGELRRRGVRPGSLAAVYLERSVESVVAILAVWKAGGAYVPIDPEYPPERVRFMLEDTRAVVVLTRQRLADALPAGAAAIVPVDAAPDGVAESSVAGSSVAGIWERRRERVSQDQLAYVIYTSGSTGRPKGVPITHASLCNLVCWHRQAYGVGPADRATQVAGPAFDGAVWETWPYLAAGASVHIADDATRLDARSMVRWLAEQRITLSFLPTPLAEAVLREEWPETVALRVLLTGGDRLAQWPSRPLPFRLVNHYGPTENTVVSTCAEVQARGSAGAAPPIGRPLPNTRAYVVDRRLQPVPIGVPGELLVGGAQLSPGYWNRPELTAEKFLADPFHPASGARVYRTGDLVRWLPDGDLEFLGRIDQQVKIRGFRIEPGEIEARIAEHPAVADVVVLAREDRPGDKRLVAYLVADHPPAELVEQLRAQLRAALPEYMVPAAFVVLERFPLTPNGKLDRQALPAPDATAFAAAGHEAPRGATETTLARIWCEVLGLERVGRHDHFFELGGHSLLAMQVVARVRQRFDVELPLRDLFAAPTVAHLAERVAGHSLLAGAAPASVTAGREQFEP